MGDAYGTMIVSHTSKAEPEKLTKALNRFLWNSENEPVKYHDNRLYVDGPVQYPTSYPDHKKIYDETNDTYIDPDHPQFDQPLDGNCSFERGDGASLEDLVKTISPVLEEGEVHIITSSLFRDFTIATGYIIINSNHTATRMAIIGGTQQNCIYQAEHYP